MKKIFAPLAMKVAGGLALVLLAGNLVLGYMLMSERITSANLRAQAANQAGVIDLLRKSILDMEEASERRAREQQAELKAAREQGKALASQAQRLRDSSRQSGEGPCIISDTLRNAEGL